jgi:Tfp pilus assembly protein FimT
LEILIVIAVLGLLAAVAIPELLTVVRRSKVEGAAHNITRLIMEARAEAVYRGSPVIVHPDARLDAGGNEVHYLVAWVDVDQNGQFDGVIAADGTYQADATQPERSVDYPLFDWQLPNRGPLRTQSNVYFWAATDADPTVRIDTVDGLTTKPDGVSNPSMVEAEGYGDWEAAVVFLDNGSVAEEGGIRFGMGPFGGSDTEVNFLELRIAPRASGRVELRKFIPSPVASYQPKGADDDPQNGMRYEWEWY